MSSEEVGWPKIGDHLFPGNPLNAKDREAEDVFFGRSDISYWYDYVAAYRDAAILTVHSLMRDDRPNILGAPVHAVVFLYRHHFELVLKTIIMLGHRLYDEMDRYRTGHALTPLWQEAEKVLKRHWPDDDDESLQATGYLISELDRVDRDSISFRYPETKNGGKSTARERHVDLWHFVDVAERMSSFLMSCCFDGLWNDLGAKQDFLSDMARMFDGEQW